MSILKTLRGRTAPLNVKDLAELLDVTEATIQRWVRKRKLPAIRVEDVIRFDPAMLADWIELQAASSQRYQDGLYRFIRVRDHALEESERKSFQISREDLGEEHSNGKPRSGSGPAEPTVATGNGHSDES
jgi:excisionase family DNA binding protein